MSVCNTDSCIRSQRFKWSMLHSIPLLFATQSSVRLAYASNVACTRPFTLEKDTKYTHRIRYICLYSMHIFFGKENHDIMALFFSLYIFSSWNARLPMYTFISSKIPIMCISLFFYFRARFLCHSSTPSARKLLSIESNEACIVWKFAFSIAIILWMKFFFSLTICYAGIFLLLLLPLSYYFKIAWNLEF